MKVWTTGQHVGGMARFAALSAVCIALSGCQSINPTVIHTEVRVIDASPDAPGLDIYQNNDILTYNMGFGSITSYVPLTPGTYSISADLAGSHQVLATAKQTFGAGKQYTVLIGNVAASLGETILTDQSSAAPSGQIALRFLDQATKIGAVDVYLVPSGSKLTGVTPLLTNVTFGTNTGYVNVPTGSYAVVLLPTGTVPVSTTIATYFGATVAYPGGSARTIILLDTQLVTSPGLQVITAIDYDSATATQ